MKYYDWDESKNQQLKVERGIGFDEILSAIEEGNLLDNIVHPNQAKYLGQRILIVKLTNYVFLIPYVEDDTKIFLKTIYPSRRFTKHYLTKKRDEQ